MDKTEMDIVYDMIGGSDIFVKYASMTNIIRDYIPKNINRGKIIELKMLPHVSKMFSPHDMFKINPDSCLKPDMVFFVTHGSSVESFNFEFVSSDDKLCNEIHTKSHWTIREMFKNKNLTKSEINMATKVMCKLFPLHLIMKDTFKLKTHNIMGIAKKRKSDLFQAIEYLQVAGFIERKEVLRDVYVMNFVVKFTKNALQRMENIYAELGGK